MPRLLLAGLILAAACSLGCGGQKLVKVTGRVTLNGADLPDGEIILNPDDPTLGPDAGKITNGKFELMAKPGPKTVVIRASRELPPTKDGAMGSVPQFESIIPAKYNDQSELKLDVPSSGVSDKLFELTSEKGKARGQ